MRTSVVFALLMVAVVSIAAQDYCTFAKDHTMCLYKGVGPSCAPKLGGGVTEADKVAILKTHNDLRQRVAQGQETLGSPGPQPPAADMRMMAWDEELAKVAQRWADQCTFDHDANGNVARFEVGQNIAWFGGGSPSWPKAVNNWYGEVKDYSNANITPALFADKTGHYTQVVWARSYLVGCGQVKYRTKDKTYDQQIYVCNYGPSGNVENAPLYVKGPGASKCPAGTAASGSKGYPALCS